MKRTRKHLYGLLCATAVSLAAGVAGLVYNADHAAADAEVQKDFYMTEGASVRIDRAGVRFQTRIKKSYYDGLNKPETGIFVIPSDLVTGDVTENTAKAKNIVSRAEPVTEGDYYVFNNVLTQIPENSYGRSLTARAYLKTEGGYEFCENQQTRSLAYVASAALMDGTNSDGEALTAEEKTSLEAYIDGAVKSITVSSDVVTVKESATPNLSVEPFYQEDDLSALKILWASSDTDVVEVNNGSLVAHEAGVAEITAKLGSETVAFAAVVETPNREIVMTDSTASLPMNLPQGFSVTSVTCKEHDLGTDLNALNIPDAFKAAKADHGETTVQVAIGNGSRSYTIDVPVTLITAKIASIADWKENVWPKNASDSVNGYYVLSQDIEQGTEDFNLATNVGDTGAYGFKGTIDGRGHSIGIAGSNGFGLFGALSNAMVKNLVVNKKNASSGWSAGLFGTSVIGTTFENTTINIKDANDTTSSQLGVFTRRGVWSSTFKNFTVNVTNSKISSLFGAENQKYRGFNANGQNCTFNDCVINIDEKSAVDELGHFGRIATDDAEHPLTVFTAAGHTLANTPEWATVTPLTGIKVNAAKSVKLADAYLLLSDTTHRVDLGEYATGYTVTSVTYNGKDLGTDVSSLSITETEAGAGNSIIVVCKNETETVVLTVPVIWVTAEIKTADDWKTHMWMEKNTSKTGYFVLANDIHVTEDVLNNSLSGANGETSTTGGDYGFRGTLDGRGFEFKFDYTVGGGLVNALGAGAVVKNITITNNSKIAPGWKSNHIFGMVAVGTTFEKVTINLNDCNYAATEKNYGPLTYDGFRECTVNDLTINITGHVNTIVGGNNQYFETYNTTFTNCKVNLLNGATLGEIAHEGNISAPTKVYCGSNQTGEGLTPLAGFAVNEVQTSEAALSAKQDVSLAAETVSLDLAEYSGYNVVSVVCGDETFGNDVNNIQLSESFKKKLI